MHGQWQRHGEDVLAARMEMRWSDMARSLLTEDAAQEAWIAVQTDLAAALRDVGHMGRAKLGEATADVRASLEAKAVELAEDGKARAAEEVRRLRDALLRENPEP